MSGFSGEHILIASLPFVFMGVFFHALNNMEETKAVLAEMWPPQTWKPANPNLFYTLASTSLACLLAGTAFGMSGNYQVAAWCFVGAWLFATLAAITGCSIFPRRARVVWSLIVSCAGGIIFCALYLWACPEFKISPSRATYQTWAGQSYKFRIDNMSDRDQYMASFIFEIASSVYSVNAFTFNIPPGSVKALDQQPAQTDRNADIFGLFGPWSDSHHFFLLYVYHFAPHESREVKIALDQHLTSTERDFQILTRTMSYSHNPFPISKNDDYVLIPIHLDRALTVTNFLPCFVNGNPPCYLHPQLAKRAEFPEGCNYWMISDSLHTQPIHVRFPEHCD